MTRDGTTTDRGEEATMAETIRTNLVVTSPVINRMVAQVDLVTMTTVKTVDNPGEVLVARPVVDLVVLPAATRIPLVTVITVVTTETRKERAY